MNDRKTRLTAAVLLAGLMLCAVGCYASRQTYVARPGAGGPPSGRTHSSAQTQSVGIGASAGVFMPPYSPTASELVSGMMWNVHAALWLSPYIAVQAAFGSCSMVDNGNPGERMTASPLTVCVLASVPMPIMYAGPGYYGVGFGGADYYRLLFGGGIGSMSLSHSSHQLAQSSMNVAYITGGAEWLFGFGARFFAVSDIYFGELVNSKTDPGLSWDFTYVVTLRVGLELGF